MIAPDRAVEYVQYAPAPLDPPPGAITVVAQHFALFDTRLTVIGDPTFDDWAAAAPVFKGVAKSSQWWLGDWVLSGQDRFGERFAQVLDQEDYTEQGLKDIVWVCERIEPTRRRSELSFEHHRKVAPLDDQAEQDYYLSWAIRHKASARALAARIKQDKGDDGAPERVTVSGALFAVGEPSDATGDLVPVTMLVDRDAAVKLIEYKHHELKITVDPNL